MDEIDQLIRDALPHMPADGFDSHAFILEIARSFQRQYVALLHASGSNTPFQDVHGKIGRRLKGLAEELGLTEGEQTFSPDIFGNTNSCVAYTRLRA